MITDFKTFMGVLVVGILITAVFPIIGTFFFLTILSLLFMAIKMYKLDVFIKPLKTNESMMLYFRKSGKIVPQICREKEQGYQELTKDYGMIRVTDERDRYYMNGKPTFVGVEGVSHTVRLEYVFLARIMNKLGIHTKEELAEFLNIPPECIEWGEEHAKKVKKG